MGYDTDFTGYFTLDPPLNPHQIAYLGVFSDTRRVKRDPVITGRLDDLHRHQVNLPVGADGGYYVGGGYTEDDGVLDYNSPPQGQPGLWCKWEPSEDGKEIAWNGAEKFYDYVEWINYIIDHFLKPWGIKIGGEVEFDGEEDDDNGVIVILDGRAVTMTHVEADELRKIKREAADTGKVVKPVTCDLVITPPLTPGEINELSGVIEMKLDTLQGVEVCGSCPWAFSASGARIVWDRKSDGFAVASWLAGVVKLVEREGRRVAGSVRISDSILLVVRDGTITNAYDREGAWSSKPSLPFVICGGTICGHDLRVVKAKNGSVVVEIKETDTMGEPAWTALAGSSVVNYHAYSELSLTDKLLKLFEFIKR